MAIIQPDPVPKATDSSRICPSMDFLTGTSDHTVTSDILHSDLWTNVLSPNSLHMYDHEKLNSTQLCQVSATTTLNEEFDLQPQFEHSDDILVTSEGNSPFVSFNNGVLFMDTGQTFNAPMIPSQKESKTITHSIDFLLGMTEDEHSEPTLSQLNSNYDDTSSQKSFSNSISSEDLAILETMFVRQSSDAADHNWANTKEELLAGCQHQSSFSRTNQPWIEQTPVTKSEPAASPIQCKQEQAMHGFSPHTIVNLPDLIPDPNFKEKRLSSISGFFSLNQMKNSSELSGTTRRLFDVKPFIAQSEGFAGIRETVPPTRDTDMGKRPAPIATAVSEGKFNEKWEEIKQFLLENPRAGPSSTGRQKRQRLDSGSSLWTSEYDSSDDSIHSDDQDSDASDGSWKAEERTKSPSKSQKHAFWQYNLQSKGPKGKRLCQSVDAGDPHILPEVEDPVFDQTQYNVTLTHGGKARRGDGNDIIPNPKKLYQLGNELKRLIKQINVFSPMNEIPANFRGKSRKEKNKIASRVCRLRKKAQHEANKVKRYGLEREHSKLMEAMDDIKRVMYHRLRGSDVCDKSASLTDQVDEIINAQLAGYRVAGNSIDFVNKVIDKVSAGDRTGGLPDLS